MTGSTVCSIGWEHAAGEGQRPFSRGGFFEERGETIGWFRNTPPWTVIQEFERDILALVGGDLFACVLFRPLLHDADKRLAPMGGVDGEEAQFAVANPAHDRFGFGRVLLSVSYVGPHEEDVGLIQRFVGESLFWVVDGCRFHQEVGVF